MNINDKTIKELESLYEKYSEQVQKACDDKLITPKTSHTYQYHANNFVRWCKGEFKPGDKNR